MVRSTWTPWWERRRPRVVGATDRVRWPRSFPLPRSLDHSPADLQTTHPRISVGRLRMSVERPVGGSGGQAVLGGACRTELEAGGRVRSRRVVGRHATG